MKEFKITGTETRNIDGIESTDINFVYDGILGTYTRFVVTNTNAIFLDYCGQKAVWGTSDGKEVVFGRRFELPKYEDFVSVISKIFNTTVPTVDFNSKELVVYYTSIPQDSDNNGIVKSVSKFMYKGIHGKYTEIDSKNHIENIIEYDGHRTCIREWDEEFLKDDIEGDAYQFPKYYEFVSQFKDTFDLDLPTTVVSKVNNHIDIIDDSVEIPVKANKQEEKISNTNKITILYTTEERGTYNGYEYFDTITKFMYNGKEGEYIKGLVENLEIYTITYDGFITTTREGDTNPSGDRYILPQYSDFVNQIKDTFGVILPTITREYNKIIIFKETTEYEGNNTIITYKFEFNGKKGTCIRTFNETRNSTQLQFDGTSAEWGFFNNEWDGNTRVYNGPEYDEFRKAANEALGISFY